MHEEVRFLLTARTQANDLCWKEVMVKVKLPSADWDTVLYLLHALEGQGYLLGPLRKEIEDQVYGQEN